MNSTNPFAGIRARTAALLLAAAGLAATPPASAQDVQRVVPPVVVATPSAPKLRPIQLVSIGVQAEVAGTLATTRVELSFLNPNARQLEGELQFPLGDDREITGFALELLDGTMMPAVQFEDRKSTRLNSSH